MKSSVTPTPVNQSSYEPVRQSSSCSTGNYRASPARHPWCLVPALRRHAEVTPVDRDAWLGGLYRSRHLSRRPPPVSADLRRGPPRRAAVQMEAQSQLVTWTVGDRNCHRSTAASGWRTSSKSGGAARIVGRTEQVPTVRSRLSRLISPTRRVGDSRIRRRFRRAADR